MNPYTYVFVRSDLSLAQQIIQASHATLECGFKFDEPESTTHLVLIEVKSEEELIRVSEHLIFNDIKYEMFYECDLPGYTAIATKPLIGAERKPLKKYKLYN